MTKEIDIAALEATVICKLHHRCIGGKSQEFPLFLHVIQLRSGPIILKASEVEQQQSRSEILGQRHLNGIVIQDYWKRLCSTYNVQFQYKNRVFASPDSLSIIVIININKMSIYSGFATRQQEQAYDNLIVDLISVLQRRIIKFYVGQQADEQKFHSILINLQHHFSKMEDSKYLEPKLALSFRELINLTSNIVPTEPQQSPPQSQQQNRKINSVPKESLNFSTDKIAQDLKYVGIGKIKHQSTSKQDGMSSRGETNPEIPLFDRNIVRSSSTNNPKQNKIKRDLQKWSSIYDSEPPAVPVQQDNEKKNIQYIIREYVNKGQRRRQKKRSGFD